MKCTSAVALLHLLASATDLDVRQTADLKYEISDFLVDCTLQSGYCVYELDIVTSDNPEFKVGCEAFGTTEKGELPAVNETQCGTYTVAVAKSDDGGLILTVKSDRKRRMGTYLIPSDDITTTMSGGQSYTGNSSFTIDVKNASSGSASVSGTSTTVSTPTVSSVSSASSSLLSVVSTATSEPSTTGTTTSSSDSPGETNGATQESAFASVMFAVGLMAFII
ncbi:hypothetical protein F5B22DRAFT_376861 [Xylaria bambusicola]|uniref:uncharacterized protein n=1 Tax=Xylaria bambusicola TaxID=326684 RepID=UPI002008129F|nr:uncharacterized protein F5B22DRAFT_376861 [Xylaria bambusicola]KAI0509029.1 hypothetical protein F5B22DRAFT_376861 [Xylaria bambusicola]